MPHVTKVHDPSERLQPLRITHRSARGPSKGRHARNSSFRVGCGCCREGIVVFPPQDALDPLVEIGGVSGTVVQWRQIFGPLLGVEPKRDKPLFEFDLDGALSFVTIEQAARLADSSHAQTARLTGRVLELDYTVRDITIPESAEFDRLSDEWAASR